MLSCPSKIFLIRLIFILSVGVHFSFTMFAVRSFAHVYLEQSTIFLCQVLIFIFYNVVTFSVSCPILIQYEDDFYAPLTTIYPSICLVISMVTLEFLTWNDIIAFSSYEYVIYLYNIVFSSYALRYWSNMLFKCK